MENFLAVCEVAADHPQGRSEHVAASRAHFSVLKAARIYSVNTRTRDGCANPRRAMAELTASRTV
jgi:hypothetical protein